MIVLDLPDGPVRVSEDVLNAAIAKVATDEFNRATDGHIRLRIGNERINMGVNEEELTALIRETIERTIRMAGGSVD